MTQHKCIELYSGQDAITTDQCCSAKQAHTRQFVTADSTMEICSSYRCPVTQHKCIATLFRARCNYHRSVLLCKTGSHKAVCHCRFNYGDLLFIQVSSDPAQMHCNSIQGKMQSPQFSAALQKRLTPGSVSQQIHLWISALHAGVQRYSTNALQLCSGQNAVSTVQCCSAIPAHTRQFGTADSPLEICSSYRCAATQHKCIAVLLRERCNSHCSVLLCKTGSHQAVCHCRFTYGDLLFTQVCSDPAQMHCSSVQGKMQFPLFSVAVQNRLTPGSVSQQIHLWRPALHTCMKSKFL